MNTPIRAAAAAAFLAASLVAQRTPQDPGESAEGLQRMAWFAQHRKMQAQAKNADKKWQFVGPVKMTGRLTDIEAHPSAPKTIYVASASGGVFKTTNEGNSWQPIFANEATASIGDIGIAPSDPKVVWIGTGEANILRSSMAGTGVYRSIDAGATFEHMGLTDTQHIARIVIHPKDPKTVYVASAGHEYTHDRSRGVYKTTDAGKTWTQVFHQDEKTGVIDLAIDPEAPDTLYAATAERLRYRWNDPKPGPQSGVYKTTDGGKTWLALQGGLPDFRKGEYERIGLDVCRSQPNTVYAIMHRALGGRRVRGAELYRSNDKGKSWKLVEGNRRIRGIFPQYGWFFGQVRVDPSNPDTVYAFGLTFSMSTDGGKRWRQVRGNHVDFHAMWVNPEDSNHVLVGNDGGLMISHDRLKSYEHPTNIPIAQCYNAGVGSTRGKFRIYCSVQDHGAWRGVVDLSDGRNNITRSEWERAPGDEAGRHVVDPTNGNIVYSVSRYGGGPVRNEYDNFDAPRSRRHGRPALGRRDKKRAQWVSPLILSPHSHERLLYGAQFVCVSDDRGDTWKKISPDLTNFDPSRQGNIAHAVIFAIAESPKKKGVIWAGTDDGNIQVTKDGGLNWDNVNKGIPEGRCISSLCASAFAEGTVYATVNGKRHDDFGCYVFRSTDYGVTWTSISEGVPGTSANVIKEDPKDANRLYLGTDRGVYVTTDGAATWHVLGSGLPTVYVHDLVLHEPEDMLVIATHGRGCFVLDVREFRGEKKAP